MQLPGNLGDKCGSEGTSERRRAGCAAAKRATRSLQRTRCERMKGGGKKKKAKGKKGDGGVAVALATDKPFYWHRCRCALVLLVWLSMAHAIPSLSTALNNLLSGKV